MNQIGITTDLFPPKRARSESLSDVVHAPSIRLGLYIRKVGGIMPGPPTRFQREAQIHEKQATQKWLRQSKLVKNYPSPCASITADAARFTAFPNAKGAFFRPSFLFLPTEIKILTSPYFATNRDHEMWGCIWDKAALYAGA
ncbi:MAG: hypothetical protein E2598_12275 [Sphingobium sp.]|nr:hypothetical protein [Sphingobium sp.]